MRSPVALVGQYWREPMLIGEGLPLPIYVIVGGEGSGDTPSDAHASLSTRWPR
jgi:hypothetical protein